MRFLQCTVYCTCTLRTRFQSYIRLQFDDQSDRPPPALLQRILWVSVTVLSVIGATRRLTGGKAYTPQESHGRDLLTHLLLCFLDRLAKSSVLMVFFGYSFRDLNSYHGKEIRVSKPVGLRLFDKVSSFGYEWIYVYVLMFCSYYWPLFLLGLISYVYMYI